MGRWGQRHDARRLLLAAARRRAGPDQAKLPRWVVERFPNPEAKVIPEPEPFAATHE